ncbi:MAG: hypothetical protein ACQEXG_11090 [Pseudomonadota bacterium]
MIDIIIVPVSQTGKDVDNAINTIDLIERNMKGFRGALFVGATRVGGDGGIDEVEYALPDALELTSLDAVEGFLVLPDNASIPLSRNMRMTSWEIAENSDRFLGKIHTKLVELHEAGDSRGANIQVRMKRCVSAAINLVPFIDKIFEQLDSRESRRG